MEREDIRRNSSGCKVCHPSSSANPRDSAIRQTTKTVVVLPVGCRAPLLIERALVLRTGLLSPVLRGSGIEYADVPPDIARLAAGLLRQEIPILCRRCDFFENLRDMYVRHLDSLFDLRYQSLVSERNCSIQMSEFIDIHLLNRFRRTGPRAVSAQPPNACSSFSLVARENHRKLVPLTRQTAKLKYIQPTPAPCARWSGGRSQGAARETQRLCIN